MSTSARTRTMYPCSTYCCMAAAWLATCTGSVEGRSDDCSADKCRLLSDIASTRNGSTGLRRCALTTLTDVEAHRKCSDSCSHDSCSLINASLIQHGRTVSVGVFASSAGSRKTVCGLIGAVFEMNIRAGDARLGN